MEMICRIMGRHHKNARDVLQTSASLETAAFLKFERALFVGVKCPTAPYLMKRSVLCTALSIHLLNCQLLLQLLVISWCRTRCRKIFHLFLGIPNEKLTPRKTRRRRRNSNVPIHSTFHVRRKQTVKRETNLTFLYFERKALMDLKFEDFFRIWSSKPRKLKFD